MWLNPDMDAGAISKRAFDQDIVAPSLAEFYHGEPLRTGLFLGFAGVSEDQLQTGLAQLAKIIRQEAKK